MCPLHAWQPGQVVCNEHGEGQSDSEAESCTGRVSHVAVLEQSPCIALSLSWLVQDLLTFLRVHHGESGIIYARLRSVCSAFLGLWDNSGAVLFAVSCPPCKYLVQQRYKIRLHHCTLHCCKHTSLQQALPCRSTCDFVAGRLQDADIDAAAYHAGLSGAARSRVQQDWSEVGGQHASRPLLQLGSYSVSVCLVPNSAMPMRGVKQ